MQNQGRQPSGQKAHSMKILLLTDIPPCENFTAGLVLSAMVRFVPRDQICIFSVTNPALDVRLGEDFANIPIEMQAKPNENWSWLPRRKLTRVFSATATFAGEIFSETVAIPSLIQKAVRFGQEQKVDRVWAVLQGQTTIRMAEAVAKKLGVPLHTHVWDPFSWWAKAHAVDRLNTRRVQALFDRAIANSHAVATASVPMADMYKQRFGVAAIPIIASHHRSMAHAPGLERSGDKPLLIGMAGQFYAANEWLQLLHALRGADWQIAGRQVRVVVLGPQQPPGTPNPHVSFLGWKSQKDAAFILSQCDILYCPYPFDPGMKEVSQFSFPSKLVLYLLAGRPIVLHGPDYSSPAHYIRAHRCGLVAGRLPATSIYNELERLVSNPESYREMAENAHAAFIADFTLESMERAFNAFIGSEARHEGGKARLHDHRTQGELAVVSRPGLSDAQRRFSLPRVGRELRGSILQGPRWLVRRSKVVVRRIAFMFPRLKALNLEIHGLYAEKAAMLAKIDGLANENTRLKSLLRMQQLETEMLSTLTEKPPVSIAAPVRVPRDLVSGLPPGAKALILTEPQTALRATAGAGASYITPPAGTLVRPLPISDAANGGLDWTDPWHDAALHLPQNSLGEELHLLLTHGLERVVVAGSTPYNVAFAIELARLASCRVTVVSTDTGAHSAWWQEHSHVDHIPGPIQAI